LAAPRQDAGLYEAVWLKAILNYSVLSGRPDVLRCDAPRFADRLLRSYRRLNATYTRISPARPASPRWPRAERGNTKKLSG